MIIELLQYYYEWRVGASASAHERYSTQYAVMFNAYEEAGLDDAAGLFLRAMDIEVVLSGSVERIITLTLVSFRPLYRFHFEKIQIVLDKRGGDVVE